MIVDEINEAVKKLLPSQIFFSDKSKYINDPILGSIKVLDYEQCIIDTKLFQRLRYIRQTGFTYFTFPTANHTRFEHSLGVMTIAERLFNIIKEKNTEISEINEDSLIRIRLASLLHDIGHSAFSHTTEEFYSNLSDISNFKEQHSDLRSKGAGEVISYLIITSQAFTDFFEELKKYYVKLENIKIIDIANLVTGKAKSNELGYEADIISGPIDADKLDYFPRDGRAVGLDVSLDIHRLINCVELHEVPDFKDPSKKRRSIIINKRGYNSLQQLLFARATLTASVYHHHKVRACDSMLKNILSVYIDNYSNFGKCKNNEDGISLNNTSNYLFITDNDIICETNNLKSEEIAHKLLTSLFSRNLFKKVLKISLKTLIVKSEESDKRKLENVKANLSAFSNLRNDINEKEKFVNEIIVICNNMGVKITKYEIALDIPHKPNFEKAGTAQINISSSNQPEIVTLKQVIPIDDWITGYETYFSHAYIFGPADSAKREIIALATAKVLQKRGKNRIKLKPTYSSVSEDIKEKVIELDLTTNYFREYEDVIPIEI